MPIAAAVRQIPKAELRELWHSFRHQTLGELQAAYRTCGVTQEEIGIRIDKDPATVSKCLRGQRNMTMETMFLLARGMDCRLRVVLEKLGSLTPVNRQHGHTWSCDGLHRPVTPTSPNKYEVQRQPASGA